MRITLVLSSFAAMAFMAGSAAAQAQQDFSKVEIKTTKLAGDFYTLEGQGGTISALTGSDGVLLVDSQFAPLTGKIVAAVKQISDKPIRFLIDTHVHGYHTGGNENFAKLGLTIFYDGPVTIHLGGEDVRFDSY
jgi:cyclase